MQESLYQPLFLKYRPQKLSDILGQDSVKETLINAINNEKIVHAYLLTGPRGSGKTSTARIIAKSLNCTAGLDGKSPTVDPCGTCESCVSIANSSSVDVTEIDAASHNKVDDARALIERVNLASVSGKYRVYIIDEVHMLTNEAFNALLKVIEEPPKNVVFVLATTEYHKVPKTISSRCQQLNFKSISIQDVITRLNYVIEQEALNISSDALGAIAKHSDGAMRDALALLDQIGVFSDPNNPVSKEKVLNLIGAVASEDLENLLLPVLTRDLAKLLEQVDTMMSSGKEPLVITQELNDFTLELLTALSVPNNSMQELISTIKEKEIEDYELVQISNSLAELEVKLKMTTQTKALFKAWLVKLAYREDIFVIKDLKEQLAGMQSGSAPRPVSSQRPAAIPQAQASIPKPAAIPAVKVKSYESKPEPVKETVASPSIPEPTKPAPVSSSAGNSFLDHLSPGSKGMFISSKASLTSVNAPNATITIPTKFKFLKSKLESRADEFRTAISQSSGSEINVLNFELADMEAGVEATPAPKPQAELKPAQEEKVQETPSAETCATRNSEDIIPVTANRDKLDEVKEAAINIFGGKELKE